MKVLAWDTSSAQGVIGAFEYMPEGPKIVSEWTLGLDTAKHSERLLWGIDQVLRSAGWSLNDLGALVVGVGPGSFTGIRIGVTTARILSSQLNIPVCPVSSLQIIARPVAEWVLSQKKVKKNSHLVVALTDAAKGEWFSMMGTAENLTKRKKPKSIRDECLAPEEVFKRVKKSKLVPVFVGSAVQRHEELFKGFRKLQNQDWKCFQSFPFGSVTPRALMQLGWENIEMKSLLPSEKLVPQYLRGSEAEVKLKKGLLKESPTSGTFKSRLP